MYSQQPQMRLFSFTNIKFTRGNEVDELGILLYNKNCYGR